MLVMKRIVTLFVSALLLQISIAQTTATDFTVNDCDGTSQHLFGEMDAGKVVVIAWVMPCSSCIAPAKTAYNVAKEFEQSNPGKVIYYLVDDLANTSCSSLKSWGTTNIGPAINAAFSDAVITMSDYGTNGMPKVVVMGGSAHQVYYNANNSAANNETAIRSAIISALGISKIENIKNNTTNVNVHPNPASDKAFISYQLLEKTELNINIYNMLGKKMQAVQLGMQNPGNHKYEINTQDYPDGVYLIKINEKTFKLKVSHQIPR
jgi:hypothetical protein